MADKNQKKGFLLRVPPSLLNELRRWAEQDMRSVNGQIEWILRDALRRQGRTVDGPTPRPQAGDQPDSTTSDGKHPEP